MKLSIITINYNNREGLRKTMESVFIQSCKDFEYIVIDGASTDGSVDIIKEYEHWLSSTSAFTLTWSSEPDNGIYNAMNKGIEIAMGKRKVNEFNCSELVEDKNKGIEIAQGEYVLMLNSGDFLVDVHVIERILPELDGTDIVQGNTIDGETRNCGYGKSNISFLDIYHAKFLHQGSFCKCSLFERIGYFDETYRFVSDTKFFIISLGYNGVTYKYIDIDIANFDLTGFSCSMDPNIQKLHADEETRLWNEMFPGRLFDFCRDSSRKVLLYDELKTHKFLWFFIMFCKKFIWIK